MPDHNTEMKKVYLYTRFERFWHWAQAIFIILLGITGFEIHGSIKLFGFTESIEWHNTLGITWLILFVFIIFWAFTTGEWKQYIPTTQKLFSMIKYYSWGIFRGETHPFPKSEEVKHNPLQRLTYLSIAVTLIPFQMVTGLLYYTYNSWEAWGLGFLNLTCIAYLHMIGAFSLLLFGIVHVYMTTTGHSIFAHMTAMISGWEEIPDEETEDAKSS